MKTKTQNQSQGLKSRSEQLSTGRKTANKLPRLDWARRHANRQLSTKQLLELLRNEAPNFLALAEVVGEWVWIHFTQKQPREITATLSQLGFHWNKRRQTWQHPCGVFEWQTGDCDPRERFGTRAANSIAA